MKKRKKGKNRQMIRGRFMLPIIIFVFIFQLNAYGDSIFSRPADDSRVCYPNYAIGAVSITDVLEWQREFQNGTQTDADFDAFFKERAVPLLQTVEEDSFRYVHTTIMHADASIYPEGKEECVIWAPSMTAYYAVFDENGEYAYILSAALIEVNPAGPYLKSCTTGDICRLDVSEKEFQEFLEEERVLKNKLNEKCYYVTEVLDESEYMNCYRGYGDLYITLVNQDKKKILEQFGFTCIFTDYSRAQAYKDMERLWKLREELGIIDIWLNDYGMGLSVLSRYKEEVFEEMLNKIEPDISVLAYQSDWRKDDFFDRHAEDKENREILFRQHAKEDMENGLEASLENPDYFAKEMYIQYLTSCDTAETRIEEENWEKLRTALTRMKEEYPEYSCQNIYAHIVGDCDADAYLNFDEELLEFVDMLGEYQADKDQMIERRFGDPQRIELKRLLRQYKEAFPKMSYQKIYEEYIKEIEENTRMNKEEKLYWYLWKKYSKEITKAETETNGETKIGADTETNGGTKIGAEADIEKQSVYPAVAGFGVLAAACVGCVILKMKR